MSLSLDELIGTLMAHEAKHVYEEDGIKCKKSIAFKADPLDADPLDAVELASRWGNDTNVKEI